MSLWLTRDRDGDYSVWGGTPVYFDSAGFWDAYGCLITGCSSETFHRLTKRDFPALAKGKKGIIELNRIELVKKGNK